MAGRTRSKLQRLLQDLDLGESSADAVGLQGGSYGAEELEPSVYDSVDDTRSVDDSEAGTTGNDPVDSSDRYTSMERRAVQLMHENRTLQATHQQQLQQAELQMAEMKAHLKTVGACMPRGRHTPH